MKKIFKFMGLALVAGSLLFVSCKDDPEVPNDTTTPTPQQTNVYKITFDGSVVSGLNFSESLAVNNQIYFFEAAGGADGQDLTLPIYAFGAVYYQGTFYPTDFFTYESGESVSDYFPNCIFPDASNEDLMYSTYTFEPSVEKFDAATNNMTATFLAYVYDEDEYQELFNAKCEELGLDPTDPTLDSQTIADVNNMVYQEITSWKQAEYAFTNYTFTAYGE